jgi:pentatricopeptide repeat protein
MMRYQIACLAVASLLLTGLSASEPDFPDADELLREATRTFLEISPRGIERTVVPVLQQRIAERLAERGEFDPMFAIISERNFSSFMSVVRRHAFEQNEFTDLIKVLQLPYAERFSLTGTYRTILTSLIRNDRIDEAEQFYGKLPERDQRQIGDFSDFQTRQKRLYALFQEDEQGQPVPKLQTVFPQSGRFLQHSHGDGPLVDTIFYGHRIPDQVWEAVDLFKANKEDEAKALFDQIVASFSEPLQGWHSGMIGRTHLICGVAAIQIELGRPDWARETFRKAEAYYEKDERSFVVMTRRQFYPVKALASIMIALGKIDAARKLIERDIPLQNDLGSPLVHCDLAVVLARSGDKAGAAEVLRNVMTVAETIDNHGALGVFLRGLAETTMRIGDKELCREFIVWAVRMPENFDGDNQWSERSDILGAAVLTQCRLKDFDGARENLEKMVLFQYEPHFSTFVDSLIKLKKYDILELFLREKRVGDGRHFVPAWRAIALSKFADGDKAGAVEAIKSAIHSAKNDGSGYRYGVPTLLVDIAMDLKYSMSDEPGRPSMEIINETIRWHQDLMAR